MCYRSGKQGRASDTESYTWSSRNSTEDNPCWREVELSFMQPTDTKDRSEKVLPPTRNQVTRNLGTSLNLRGVLMIEMIFSE
jgi:hypothetical protein